MNKNNEVFKTRDFYLACFLKTKGIKLTKVIRDGKVAVFYFKFFDELEKIITDFYNGTEMVSAITFINSIRDLKAFIHNI